MNLTLIKILAEWFALVVALSIALMCSDVAGASFRFTPAQGDTRMNLDLKDALVAQPGDWPLADDFSSGVQMSSVGPVLGDTFVTPVDRSTTNHKHDSTFHRKFGGGAWNEDQQLRRLQVRSCPVFLTGPDDLGRLIGERVDEASPNAVVIPILEQTRETFILEGECYTVRSAVADRQAKLPAAAANTITAADMVLMAPMRPEDINFQQQVIDLSTGKVILQLSSAQCLDPTLAFELAGQVWLLAINAGEAQQLVGTRDSQVAIRRIRARGVRNVLITHANGVDACIEGQPYQVPRYQSSAPTADRVATGDVFLATVGALVACKGKTSEAPVYETAIRWGLAAAVLHAEGYPNPGDRRELAKIVGKRQTVEVAPPATSTATKVWPMAVTAGRALALLVGLLRSIS